MARDRVAVGRPPAYCLLESGGWLLGTMRWTFAAKLRLLNCGFCDVFCGVPGITY